MLLRGFFLKALFFKTKDEKRETNRRQKESSDFFRWFGSFLLLLQNNPKLWGRGKEERGILMIVYNLIYEILYRKT